MGDDPGGRTRLWRDVDPTRTAHDGRMLGPDPGGAYLRFASAATFIPPAPPRRPVDVDHHLSTLFPPVRPRGYLELRAMDAQPMSRLGAAVAVAAAVVADRVAACDVIDVLGADPVALARRWRLAAAPGPSTELAACGGELLVVARAALERVGWLDPPPDAMNLDLFPTTQTRSRPCMQFSSRSI